jgi:hypothetical protein
MKNLIVLAGKAGSGKDYFADRLIEKLVESDKTSKVTKTSFAFPLKEFAASLGFPRGLLFGPSQYRNYTLSRYEKDTIAGFSRAAALTGLETYSGVCLTATPLEAFLAWMDEFESKLKSEEPITTRWFLQEFGTGFCRRFLGNDVLANAALKNADRAISFRNDVAIITDGRFENELRLSKAAGAYVVHIVNPLTANEKTTHISEAQDFDSRWIDYVVVNDRKRALEVDLNYVVNSVLNEN